MTGTLSRNALAVALWVVCGAVTAGDADDLRDRRLYEVVPVKKAPRIDGRLDDACWQGVPVMGGFQLTITACGEAVDAPTEARLVYHGHFLYIGVTCHEPHPERIVRRVTAHDVSAVCGDDAVEIFIHPDLTQGDYYQLAANVIGTRDDGRGLDGSWNGTWQACGAIGKRAWTLEAAVDLRSLGRLPEPGAVWGFNLNRERPSVSPRQYQCWSDTGGAFHTPERFGRIIFGGPFSGLRRVDLVESARLALASLELERQIVSRVRVIDRSWEKLPATQRRRYVAKRTELVRAWQALGRQYADRRTLSAAQWASFVEALRRMCTDADAIAWACRFHELLSN